MTGDGGPSASSTVTCIDLDRTVIYSPSALLLPGVDHEAPRLLCVEVYRGAPLSFLTETAGALLEELAGATVLVSTTTRTPEQLARVHLPGAAPPPYAIASNGGHLLVDGVVDQGWSARVARSLRGTADVEQVRAHVERHSGPFVQSLRVASGLFVYSVVDRDRVPAGWVEELSAWCAERGWGMSLQGRKVYCVPLPLTKSAAAREVQARTGAAELVAAGDSLLDGELLAAADRAVRPAQGELASAGWTVPGLHVTTAPGVLGGEELVRWLLEAGRPTSRTRVSSGRPAGRTPPGRTTTLRT